MTTEQQLHLRNGCITACILVYNVIILTLLMDQLYWEYIFWGTICLNAFAAFLIMYNTGVYHGKIGPASSKAEKDKTLADKLADLGIALKEVTRIVPWIFCELGISLFYILVFTTVLAGLLLKRCC